MLQIRDESGRETGESPGAVSSPGSKVAVRDLRAGYGPVEVVHGVSIDFSLGETVLLTGHNGAGKSTLLEAATGICRSSGGSVTVGSVVTTTWSTRKLRRNAGLVIVPQGGGVLRGLSVEENLKFFRTIGRCSVDTLSAPPSESVWEEFFPALLALRKHQAGTLSGGEFRQVAILNALLSRPRYLIIDEPFLGVARGLCGVVKQALVLARQSQIGILLVEQQIRLIEDLVSRCYVMRQGQLVEHLTADELRGLKDVSRVL